MESSATDCSCWRFLLVGFAPCKTKLKRGSSLGQKLRVWAVEGWSLAVEGLQIIPSPAALVPAGTRRLRALPQCTFSCALVSRSL